MSNTRIILNYPANQGPKYDTQFATTSIRQLKPCKTTLHHSRKIYDTEPIRKCINEKSRSI